MKSRLILASLAAAAALAVLPSRGDAQFTTFVPPKKVEAVDTAATAATVAQADSIQRQTITDMRVWVDSAARSLANVDTTRIDSTVVDSMATEMIAQAPAQAPTTEFREGAPAPDTATMFPMLALAAIGCLGAGVLLLRRGA